MALDAIACELFSGSDSLLTEKFAWNIARLT